MNEKWFDIDNTPFLQAINEGYFGETPEIQKCQKLLTKFRDKFAGPKYTYNTKDIISKELRDFENAMADTFGFESFCLSIDHSQYINACTMPVGMCYDEIKSSAKYCCWIHITAGFIFDRANWSDREVMAIILHEVGHNFSAKDGTINICKNIGAATVIAGSCIAALFSPALAAMILIVNSSNLKNLQVQIRNKLVKDNPNMSQLVNLLNIWTDTATSLMGEVRFVQNLLSMGAFSVINTLISQVMTIATNTVLMPSYPILKLLSGYSDEKFADGFPAMYGYGPDIGAASAKLDNQANHGLVTPKFLEKHCPLLLTVYDAATLPLRIVLQAIDEHPVTVERMQNNVRILQQEASNTKNPKLIKRINDDIRRMNKDIEDNYDPKKISSKKDHSVISNYVTRLYYGVVLSLFKGDFKRHIYGLLFDTNTSLTTEGDKKHMSGIK